MKAGTWNHIAWGQGAYGVPLHVNVSDSAGLKTVPPNQQQQPQVQNVEAPNPRKSGSLFE